MALDAEAAQPTISAHIALRIAISVYGFDRRLQLLSRQARLLHVNSRSRAGRTGVRPEFQ